MREDPDRQEGMNLLVRELKMSSFLTPRLFSEINRACNRMLVPVQFDETRVLQLLKAGANIDAAIMMLELRLATWRIRRLVLDDGLWHCSLSRQPHLPIDLDATSEGQHEHMATAILIAFVEALRMEATAYESADSMVDYAPFGCALCCDNFS